MRVEQKQLSVQTRGQGLLDITADVQRVLSASGLVTGLCTLFVQHTSASLVIQENADPAVQRDLGRWMDEVVPRQRDWEHTDEGPDDMPAHARAALTRTSETVPFAHGTLSLGTWQAIYLWEHRERPHRRAVVITLMGD